MEDKKRIKVLDCTFRDGGYANDWHFGFENGGKMLDLIGKSGVDIIEVGLIDNYDYDKDHFKFSDMNQIANTFRPSPYKLAGMITMGSGYDFSMIPRKSENTVDIIRVVLRKKMLYEGVELCKELINKGYDVCIQATRSNQYTLSEMEGLVKMFNEINPYALYVVDSFGSFEKDSLLEYVDVVDSNLNDNSLLGFHPHNNMQQAFSNTLAIAERGCKHKLIFDASVLGMGRGAGNLSLELLLKYLNEKEEGIYNEESLLEVAEDYLKPFYNKAPWGYKYSYLLSARYACNPTYVTYMENAGLTLTQMNKVFKIMVQRGIGIRFEPKICDEIIKGI